MSLAASFSGLATAASTLSVCGYNSHVRSRGKTCANLPRQLCHPATPSSAGRHRSSHVARPRGTAVRAQWRAAYHTSTASRQRHGVEAAQRTWSQLCCPSQHGRTEARQAHPSGATLLPQRPGPHRRWRAGRSAQPGGSEEVPRRARVYARVRRNTRLRAHRLLRRCAAPAPPQSTRRKRHPRQRARRRTKGASPLLDRRTRMKGLHHTHGQE